MLAKPAATLPAGKALLGGTVYEPKWDGYRAILERTPQGCRVWSRNGADLTPGFPEVVRSACDQLRPGTVVDGELVVWSDGRLDFAALGPRLAYGGRRRPPPGLAPPTFLAFDVLAVDDVDVRGEPLRVRRRLLEQLAGSWRPPLQLTPQTAEVGEAQQWLAEYVAADVGVDARTVLMVVCVAAAGKIALDTVTTELDRDAVIRADAGEAALLGFRGKFAIHPKQVPVIRAAFRPDEVEVARSLRMLAAGEGRGAVLFEGEMIDEPMLRRARGIVAAAKAGQA